LAQQLWVDEADLVGQAQLWVDEADLVVQAQLWVDEADLVGQAQLWVDEADLVVQVLQHYWEDVERQQGEEQTRWNAQALARRQAGVDLLVGSQQSQELGEQGVDQKAGEPLLQLLQLCSQCEAQQQQSAITARRVEVEVPMASTQPRADVVLQTHEGLAVVEDLQQQDLTLATQLHSQGEAQQQQSAITARRAEVVVQMASQTHYGLAVAEDLQQQNLGLGTQLHSHCEEQ
jgi:hypothetical protein